MISIYKNGLREHRIIGALCPQCEAKFLPPRPICNVCNNDNLDYIEFGDKGVVIGFTKVAVVPSAMAKVGFSSENPYWTCMVALEEGINVPAVLDLSSADSLKHPFIGMNVSVVFDCAKGIYFKPI